MVQHFRCVVPIPEWKSIVPVEQLRAVAVDHGASSLYVGWVAEEGMKRDRRFAEGRGEISPLPERRHEMGRASGCGDRSETAGPWSKQGMERVGRWVGVAPVGVASIRGPNAEGGWGDEAYQQAYAAHAPVGGREPKIGRFLGAEDAFASIVKWRKNTKLGWEELVGDAPPSASTELHWDPAVASVAWGPGFRCWYPRGGCWAGSNRWPPNSEARVGIGMNMKRCRPLPLVMVSGPCTEEQQDILAKTVRDYVAAGFIRPWDFARGIPTIVMPVHAIFQGEGEQRKARVISDMRYANSAIEVAELVVPSVKLIASYVEEGDVMLKIDLKAGYPQMRLTETSYSTFEFDGIVYEFVTPPFGARHVPGRFQHHTAHVAQAAQEKFKIRVFVYIDDFFFIARRGSKTPDPKEIMDFLASFGLVIGLKKSTPDWVSRVEVLGIILDTKEMILKISEKKKGRIMLELHEALSATKGSWNTLRQAQLLGRLVSIEPAVKNIMLATRPSFNDLAIALGKDTLEPFTRLSETSSYAWGVKGMEMSPLARSALETLVRCFDEWHGRGVLFDDAVDIGVQADAGEYAAGGVTVDQEGVEVDADGVRLPDELIGESSLVREAWALSASIRRIPIKILRGKRLGAQVDNLGLASRFAKGVACLLTTDILVNLLFYLVENGAELVYVRWVPRERNALADKKSKENTGGEDMLFIRVHTLKRIFEGEGTPPTVDGLASKTDKVLERYCTLEQKDGYSCGNYFEFVQEDSDVMWLHPPLPIIRRCMKRWFEGASRTAYILVPRIPHARWMGLIEVLNGKLYYSDVEVERGSTSIGAHWRFDVYRLDK